MIAPHKIDKANTHDYAESHHKWQYPRLSRDIAITHRTIYVHQRNYTRQCKCLDFKAIACFEFNCVWCLGFPFRVARKPSRKCNSLEKNSESMSHNLWVFNFEIQRFPWITLYSFFFFSITFCFFQYYVTRLKREPGQRVYDYSNNSIVQVHPIRGID